MIFVYLAKFIYSNVASIMTKSYVYHEVFYTYNLILIISCPESDLNTSNNSSNNKNLNNYAPYFIKKVIRELKYQLFMMMAFKLLEQNLQLMTKNLQLLELFLFHIQVTSIYCLLFLSGEWSHIHRDRYLKLCGIWASPYQTYSSWNVPEWRFCQSNIRQNYIAFQCMRWHGIYGQIGVYLTTDMVCHDKVEKKSFEIGLA